MAAPLPSFTASPGGLADLVSSAPPACKALAVLTMGLWGVGAAIPGAESVLSLKATNTYGAHSYFWNIFTYGFYNTNILTAVVCSIAYLVVGRFLVHHWGMAEMARFICFTNLCCGLSLFLWQIFRYMVTFDFHNLEEPVQGSMGLITALSLTLKHRLPDEPLKIGDSPLMGLAARDIPVLVVWFSAACSFFGIAKLFAQSLLGLYFGWLYLRFIQRGQDGHRGDSSDEMSFIAFFPPVLRPFAQILSTSAYKIVCGKAVRALLDDLPIGNVSGGAAPFETNGSMPPAQGTLKIPAPPLPGSNPADAERRRARALKSLNERLLSLTSSTPEAHQYMGMQPPGGGAGEAGAGGVEAGGEGEEGGDLEQGLSAGGGR